MPPPRARTGHGSGARAALLLAALLLTGCGSDGGGQDAASAPDREDAPGRTAPAVPDGCDAAAPRTDDGALPDVDADGDGTVERLVPGSPRCGHLLVVGGDGVPQAALEVGEVPVTEAFAAQVPRGPRLLVTRQDVARGGYQLRVFAHVERGLEEVLDTGGNPLVPFVATDTSPPTPVALECEPGRLVLTEVVPGPSVEAGWEVRRRTFAVGEDGAALEEQTDLSPATAPGEQLLRRHPELRGNPVLEDCRAP